jgi:hypothetical protein
LIGEVCDGFIVDREVESAVGLGKQEKGRISFQKPEKKASRLTSGSLADPASSRRQF